MGQKLAGIKDIKVKPWKDMLRKSKMEPDNCPQGPFMLQAWVSGSKRLWGSGSPIKLGM
jgi:hypothetical protein